MVAFTTRMPMGFIGQISRDPEQAVVETEMLDTSVVPTGYGQFVKTVSGKIQAFASGDVAASITGLLIRSYPHQSLGNGFGGAAPVGGNLCNRMRRGYAIVACAAGTPAQDGAVYIRLDTGGAGGTVGQLEAASDTTHNAIVPGARFTGAADASGNVEIAYNL